MAFSKVKLTTALKDCLQTQCIKIH